MAQPFVLSRFDVVYERERDINSLVIVSLTEVNKREMCTGAKSVAEDCLIMYPYLFPENLIEKC